MAVKINKRFVKHMLAEKDMSLRDLSQACGIGEATIYRVVNGGTFQSVTLGRLAEALQCSPVDLIDVEGFANPLVVAPAAALVA